MELDLTKNLNTEQKGRISPSFKRNLLTIAGAFGCAAIAGMGYMGTYNNFYNHYLEFYNNGGEAAITLAEESINILSLLGAGYFIYRGIRPASTTEESLMVVPNSETNYGLVGLRKQKAVFNPQTGLADIQARAMFIQRDTQDGENTYEEGVVLNRLEDAIIGATHTLKLNDSYTDSHVSVTNPVDTNGETVYKTVKRTIPLIGRTIITRGVPVVEKNYHILQSAPADARKLDPEKCPSGFKMEPNGTSWCNLQIAFPLELANQMKRLVTTPNFEKHQLHEHLFKLMEEYGQKCKPETQRPFYIIEWIDGQEPVHHPIENIDKLIKFIEEKGISLTGVDQQPPEKIHQRSKPLIYENAIKLIGQTIERLKPLVNFN
jgi:hypothetical protein